ncbi:MAG: hypothetical protein PHD48_02545 [Alphaproteobacteria bacterium]|nr:hypothetical protein [Alphaproteobacteria bacterium]
MTLETNNTADKDLVLAKLEELTDTLGEPARLTQNIRDVSEICGESVINTTNTLGVNAKKGNIMPQENQKPFMEFINLALAATEAVDNYINEFTENASQVATDFRKGKGETALDFITSLNERAKSVYQAAYAVVAYEVKTSPKTGQKNLKRLNHILGHNGPQ